MPQRAPHPRGFKEQLEAGTARKPLILLACRLIADDGVGDVGVDVKRRRPRGPVARALLTVDSAPRERRALQAERGGALAGELERLMAPQQRIARRRRRGIGEHGQHERLGVPERVSVVARPGQALGGDRAPLGPRARLERVEEAEANGLLQFGVAVDLDVRSIPEVIQISALLGDETVPAVVPRLRQGCGDLVDDGRRGALPGPSICEELDDAKRFPGSQVGRHVQTGQVLEALRGRRDLRRPVDHVIHRRRHRQAAGRCRMRQQRARVLIAEVLRAQRRGQRRRCARIALGGGQLLVGDELRLHHHRRGAVERIDLVEDRGDGPLCERHQARA